MSTSTSTSMSRSTVSFRSSISGSQSGLLLSQGGEDPVVRHVANLHKLVTGGQDLGERELVETVSVLQEPGERIVSENMTTEKLKKHLIMQGKYSEAKNFMELYQKLKGIPFMKNRDAVLYLMYELFDKEPSRLLMARRKALKGSGGVPSSTSSGDTIVSRAHTAMVRKVEPLRASRNVSDEMMDLPMLNYPSDYKLKEELEGRKGYGKLPSMRKEGAESMESVIMGMGSDLYLAPSSTSTSTSTTSLSRPYAASTNFPFTKSPNSSFVTSRSHLQLSSETTQSIGGSPLKGGTTQGQKGVITVFQVSKQFEKELIRDLVFVFQGIDGVHVKSDKQGNYDIVTNKQVPLGLRLQTLRLAELGFFYKQIHQYVEQPIVGLMAQGFKHALDLEIQEYLRLLAIVQTQVQQTVVDTPMSEPPPLTGDEMTMLKLTVWMFDCRPRLDAVAGIIGALNASEARGGEICSILYKYSLHGDPMIRSVTNSLLSTTAKPLYLMLCQWILYGELEDPYEEFFIKADVGCRKEHLWHSKYTIRESMLPSFISLKQAEKILATGKNINFLREICNHTLGYEGRGQIKASLENREVDCMFSEEDKVLNVAIDRAYKTTSKMVLDVLIKESQLIIHLKAIKNYLLLGQGDFIQHLLELIQRELQKPANRLFAHNISAILESAVRATNAQFESEDVLCRLDTRILASSDKDIGWDVFCLDYKVHGPIGTVLTEEVTNRYNQLFNALWRIKRVEMILNTLWKDQTALFKYQRIIPELGSVLHRSQLLISEMIHFVHQTQYYIMFEATECAWEKLMAKVTKAIDLDEVIQAHSSFLEAITKHSLLDREKRELLNQLRAIFETVHELKSFLFELERNAGDELRLRKRMAEEEHEGAKKRFFKQYIAQAKGKIETLYTTTQDLVRSFLLALNRQPDLTLQCLSFRLDFNEYYHHKDSMLSRLSTYQHRRKSSNTFDPPALNLASMSRSGLLNNSVFAGDSSFSMLEDEEED